MKGDKFMNQLETLLDYIMQEGMLLEWLKKRVRNNYDRAMIYSYLEDFFDKNDGENVQQIKEIVLNLKDNIVKEIRSKNINVINNLEKCINQQMERFEIPEDQRFNITENLKCYIMCAIMDSDKDFYNDLQLKKSLDELKKAKSVNEKAIDKISKQLNNYKKIINNRDIILKYPFKMLSSCPNIDNANNIVEREQELAMIWESFSKGSNIVFLYGRPGMGKTTVAKLYARKYYNNYQHIYMVKYMGTLEASIGNLAKSSKKNGANKILNYWINNADEAQHTLLILDNFDEEDKKDGGNVFSSQYYKNLIQSGVKIIVTTRTNFGKNGIKIEPVSDPVKLFLNYCNEHCDDLTVVEDIINTVHKNTLVIILVSTIWGQRCHNDEERNELLTKLKNCKMKEDNRKVTVFADIQDNDDKTLYEQINAMLDFDKIFKNETNISIFANVALLPLEGINIRLLLDLCGYKDDNEINHLIDGNWVLKDADGTIYLHPLVREIVLNKGIITYKRCYSYCHNIAKKIDIKEAFENKNLFEKYAYQIFNILKDKKDVDVNLERLFYNLSDIYDKLGEWKLSKEITTQVAAHIELFDNDLIEKAVVLSGIAYTWNNYSENMEMLDQAKKYLDDAYKILVNLKDCKTDVRYIRAFGMVLSNQGSNSLAKAKCNVKMKRSYLDNAIEWHEKALEYRQNQVWTLECKKDVKKEDIKNIKASVATSYTTLATDYFYDGQYKNAIDFHLNAMEIRNNLNDWKGVTVNQQRVIGCVIAIYRENFEIEEKFIDLIMPYYPKLLQKNYEHNNYNSLNCNMDYLRQLKKIIINDKRLDNKTDQLKEVCNQVYTWSEGKSKIKGMCEDLRQ